MRVAIITRALAPYHKALQEPFADAVATSGGTVKIFYPQGTASAFDYEKTLPKSPAITIEHVPSMRVPPVLMKLGMRWKTEANESRLPSQKMWQTLSAYDPHIIWVHELSPYSLAGLLWAKLHGRIVVYSTEIGCDNEALLKSTACLWHRFWGRWADGVIACTKAALKPLCGLPIPVVSAFHAADSRHLIPKKNDVKLTDSDLCFIQTASVTYRKGADLLLAALQKLQAEGIPNWRLKLLGKDHDGWGQAQISKYQLDDHVQIMGHLDGSQLWDSFASSDVFVLATRSDTYGAVVHEAACLGLPLIVSKHAGAADALVKDGINGFIIDPDNTTQFADRLKRLFDPDFRVRMATESRSTGELFSAHIRAQAIWQWFQNHFVHIE